MTHLVLFAQASKLAGPCFRCIVLAALPPVKRWSLSNHRHWPAPFKAAVRQLLLAAARQQRALRNLPAGKGKPPGATLASLPAHILQHIVHLASGPLSFWLSLSQH